MTPLEEQIVQVALDAGVDPGQLERARVALDKMRSLGLNKSDLADVLAQTNAISAAEVVAVRAKAELRLRQGAPSGAPTPKAAAAPTAASASALPAASAPSATPTVAAQPVPKRGDAALYAVQRQHDLRFARVARGAGLTGPDVLDGGLNVQENQFKRSGEIATLASILAGRNVLSADECTWIESALTREAASASAAAVDRAPVTRPPAPAPLAGATDHEPPPSRLEGSAAAQPPARRKRVEAEDDLADGASAAEPLPPLQDIQPAIAKAHPAGVRIVTEEPAPQRSADPAPPPSRLEAPGASAPGSVGRKRVAAEDELAESPEDDQPPPSRLVRSDNAAPSAGSSATPPKRARRPLRLAALLPFALATAGVALCFGLYYGLAWLDRSADDGAYQQAMSLVRAEENEAAIEALMAYLEANPAGIHRSAATLAAQELVLNRGQVHARLGLTESAIADFRLVRELDPDAEPAQRAQGELGVLATTHEQGERDRRWREYVERVEGLVSQRKLREATDALRTLPFDTLSEAEAATRDALAERARAALETQELARFCFVGAETLGLPTTMRPVAQPGPDALARYRVGESAPLDPPAVGPEGVVPVLVRNTVLGVDARTAALRWRRELPPGARCFSPIAIKDAAAGAGVLPGSALVVDNSRQALERIDLADGTPLWTRYLGAAITAAPMVLPPHAYVGAADGRLYRLALATGECDGAYVTGDAVVASPAYDAISDLLLIGSGDGFCYAFGLGDGAFRGRIPAPPHPGVPPILCGDIAFVPHAANGSTELVVQRLAAAAGRPLVATEITRIALDGTIRTPALVRGGRVAVATDRDVLLVLAVDGAAREPVYGLTREPGGRRVSLSGPIHLVERALGQELLLAADDLQQFTLPKPGASETSAFGVELVWRHEDPRTVEVPILGIAEQAPVQQGDWLLLATREPGAQGLHLHSFDLANRTSLWRRTFESGSSDAAVFLADPGPLNGRLVLATEDGAVHGVSFDGGPPIYRRIRAGGAQLPSAGMAAVGEGLLLGRGRELIRIDSISGERDPAFTPDFALKGDVCAGPVVAGALAFFATANGTMYALDAATGKAAVDHFTTPSGKAVSTEPLCADGLIVVGAHDHTWYGLEVAESRGRRYLRARWTIKTGGDLRVRPLALGAQIWAGGDDGKLRGIAPDDGKVVVEIQLPAAIDGPLVLIGPSLVLVPTADRRVVAVSLESHAPVWSQALAGLVRTAALEVDGKIWIATTAGKLYRLDRDSGAIEWTHALAERFLGGAIHRAGPALYAFGHSGYLYEIPLDR